MRDATGRIGLQVRTNIYIMRTLEYTIVILLTIICAFAFIVALLRYSIAFCIMYGITLVLMSIATRILYNERCNDKENH